MALVTSDCGTIGSAEGGGATQVPSEIVSVTDIEQLFLQCDSDQDGTGGSATPTNTHMDYRPTRWP